jgi:hypothetical protein
MGKRLGMAYTIADFLNHREASSGIASTDQVAVALFRLHWMTSERMGALATHWLSDGSESEAIVRLASGLYDSWSQDQVFRQAMADVGRTLIPDDDAGLSEAGLLIARLVAEEMLAGSIDADNGASALDDLCWRVGYPEWAIPFDRMASGVDTDGALAEARKLLDYGKEG